MYKQPLTHYIGCIAALPNHPSAWFSGLSRPVELDNDRVQLMLITEAQLGAETVCVVSGRVLLGAR
jgi:hypothetical protein